MQLGTRLEDHTLAHLRQVADRIQLPIKNGNRLKTKSELIDEMRALYVRPAILGTSFTQDELKDIKLAIQSGSPEQLLSIVKGIPKTIPRTVFYKTDAARLSFDAGYAETCPYDLAEIARAADVESYIAISIRKHREQILKDGYFIKSTDTEIKRYVENRVFELSLRSPCTFDDTIRETITNLIKYHTAFIVIERDAFKSTGRKVEIYGKTMDPISAVYSVDPLSMRPILSKNRNRVIAWEYIVSGERLQDASRGKWPETDVIAITIDKKSGFLFGTPYILPVLDDVRALRKLEELTQIVTVKHAFPLIHWKVGTEEIPAKILDDGTSEVDLVVAQAESYGDSGAIVTSERTTLTVIGAEGEALDLKPYLDYFEDRALGGLRLSDVDLGRGCYDEQTETLTENGWKYWYEINHETEKIATYNPVSNSMEYKVPNWRYVAKYRGPMIRFRSQKHIDMLVTPDHDMWVCYDKQSLKWHKEKALSLLERKSEWFFIKDNVGSSDGIEWGRNGFVTIPWIDYLRYQKFRNTEDTHQACKDTDVRSTDLAELIGWYLTDGHIKKAKDKYNFSIYQVKEDGVLRLRSLFNRLPFKSNIRIDKRGGTIFEINHKGLVKWIVSKCGRMKDEKRIPRELILSKRDTLEALMHGMVSGDGSISKGIGCTGGIYYTHNKQLRDDFQEIAIRLGYSAKWRITYSPSREYGKFKLPSGFMYRVFFTNGKPQRDMKKDYISLENYDGYIYCFNVENNLFLTRRNGKVAIQGNSTSNKSTAQSMTKNIQDASLDYQRAFSQSISWKLLLYLAMEGGFNVDQVNMPVFTFPPIDSEEERARQTHATLLYQSNLLNEDEVRTESLGREPMTEEQRKKTFMSGVEMPKIEKTEKIKAQVKSVSQPANQSGRKATKTKIKANDMISSSYYNYLNSLTSSLLAIYNSKVSIKADELILAISNDVNSHLYTLIIGQLKKGANDASIRLNRECPRISPKYIRTIIDGYIHNLLQATLSRYILSTNDTNKDDIYLLYSKLDILKRRLVNLYTTTRTLAYRTGYIKAARIFNYEGEIDFLDPEEEMKVDSSYKFDQKMIPIRLLSGIKPNLIPYIREYKNDTSD